MIVKSNIFDKINNYMSIDTDLWIDDLPMCHHATHFKS